MNVKKVTNKDRYGNSTTVEYESPEKPLDPNKMLDSIINSEGQLFGWDGTLDIPPVFGEQFNMGDPATHPGGPKGEDIVPAWLTPGEFVVNKEAMSIPENAAMVDAINEQGRAMQKGGSVPMGGMTTHLEMNRGGLAYAVVPNPHMATIARNMDGGLGTYASSASAGDHDMEDFHRQAYAMKANPRIYDKGGWFGIGKGMRDRTPEEMEEERKRIAARVQRANDYFADADDLMFMNDGGMAMPTPHPYRGMETPVSHPRYAEAEAPMPESMPIPYDQALLEAREGYRPDVYLDSLGKPTVGHGHLLPPEMASQVGEMPYTEDELDSFFAEDRETAQSAARRNVGDEIFDSLNRQQQGALTSMAFQLGEKGQKKFKKMIEAIKRGDHSAVAKEALTGSKGGKSKWLKQTPKRALDLAMAFDPDMAAQYQNDGGMIFDDMPTQRNRYAQYREGGGWLDAAKHAWKVTTGEIPTYSSGPFGRPPKPKSSVMDWITGNVGLGVPTADIIERHKRRAQELGYKNEGGWMSPWSDAFGDVSETIVGSGIEGVKEWGKRAGDAASWAKENPDEAQKAILDNPAVQIGGAFVPGVGEALDAREVVEGGREIYEDPSALGGYGRVALGVGALLLPFVGAGALKAMGKSGVEATEAAIKAGKSADEVAAIAAKYSDEAADAIRATGRGGKGLIGDAAKRAGDWVKDPRTYVGDSGYGIYRGTKEALTNPVGWAKAKIWDAPVAGRIAHGKVDPSDLKGIAKDAHAAYPWMHPEEALKLFRSEIADGKALTAMHKRHMQGGGMVPQYRFGGGWMDEGFSPDPNQYGWNVEQRRPNTYEEGIVAGTVAPSIPAPMAMPDESYSPPPAAAAEEANPTGGVPPLEMPTALSMPSEDSTPAPSEGPGIMETLFPGAYDPYVTMSGNMGDMFAEPDMGEGSPGYYQDIENAAIAESPEYKAYEGNVDRARASGLPQPKLSPEEWADQFGGGKGQRAMPFSDVMGQDDTVDAVSAAVDDGAESAVMTEDQILEEAGKAADAAAKKEPTIADQDKTKHDPKAFFQELLTTTEAEDPAADNPAKPSDKGQQSETEVENAGKEEMKKKPGLFAQTKSLFEDLGIGDLLDKGELTRMAVMYLGSRALGYSHHGSLNWSAKNYLTRVDAKSANRQSQAAEFAKSGKYTPQSVANYKKTGDLSQLVGVGASYTPTGKSQVKMIGGKKVPLMEVKGSDGGIYFQGPNGQILNAGQIATAKDYDPAFEKDTTEFRARRARANDDATARFEEIRAQSDTFYDKDGRAQHATKIPPRQAASEFWSFAESMGMDPESEEALAIMTNAYQEAINDAGTSDVKPTRLTPYLQNEYIREKTGSPELFITNNPKPGEQPQYVRGDKMSILNQNVEWAASQLPGLKGLAPQDASSRMYDLAIKEWNDLGVDGQDMYKRSAEKGESGFYVFMNKRMAQLLQKL